MNSGVVFKWVNKSDIYKNKSGQGKSMSMRAYINKLNTEYIATRPGVDQGKNFKHGLFGEFKSENGLIDVEDLDLSDITEYVGEKSKENIDIFKTVISLNSEDAIRLGFTSKDKWKELVDLKINQIVQNMKPPIDIKDIEYFGAFHIKEPNMHCHISFWNKNQKDFSKKPFMNYDKIRKELSKEIFKEELKVVYKNKDEFKKLFRQEAKEDLKEYKENLKELLKIKTDVEVKQIDTSKEEKFLKDKIDNLEVGNKIYIYDKNNPNSFTEISKEFLKTTKKDDTGNIVEADDTKFGEVINFKNNGEDGILYKENTISDTACFLKNLSEIEVCDSKEEFEGILNKFNEREEYLENLLREVTPDILPEKILSNKFRESSIPIISNKLFELKNLIEKQMESEGKKMNFKYGFYSSDIKKQIDSVSTLILNASKDCKNEFNNYILNFTEIEKLKGEFNLNKKQDLLRVQRMAKDDLYEMMGNQILQFLKENIIENKKEEWQKLNEEKQEEWKNKKHTIDTIKEIKQKNYNESRQKNEVKDLINTLSKGIGHSNTALNSRKNTLRKSFANMTKDEIKAKMQLKANSSGFDWFEEE